MERSGYRTSAWDIGRRGGVRELAEQAADHEGDLLADVHGVVADALDVARDQHHVRGPLPRLRIAAADVDRGVEDLAVEAVDDVVLLDEILGELEVAVPEGDLCLLIWSRACVRGLFDRA